MAKVTKKKPVKKAPHYAAGFPPDTGLGPLDTPSAALGLGLHVEEYGAKPAIASRAITCKHCKHSYLKPCKDDKAKSKCRNWQHIQGK